MPHQFLLQLGERRSERGDLLALGLVLSLQRLQPVLSTMGMRNGSAHADQCFAVGRLAG